MQHLCEAFGVLRDLECWSWQRPSVAFALFFHDAVYDVGPGVHNNEMKSLLLAEETARNLGIHVPDLAGLVMATRHDGVQDTDNRRLLVDADLAILGASRARYIQYTDQIRREYAWVPEGVYRVERAKVMRVFLRRSREGGIFHHPRLRELREEQACKNIAYELQVLESTP